MSFPLADWAACFQKKDKTMKAEVIHLVLIGSVLADLEYKVLGV